MKKFGSAMLMTMIAGLLSTAPMSAAMNGPPASDSLVYLKYEDFKWDKLIPGSGPGTAEIAVLHVNPKTGATQLAIRLPKNYYIPKHWHTANESIYDVYGNFVMQDENGKVGDLSPGSYGYMPRKMVHEGWSKADSATLLFVTVDGPWDIHFIDGAPTQEQVQDVSKRPVLQTHTKAPAIPSSKADFGY